MQKDDAVRDRGDGGKSYELGDCDEDEGDGVDDELSDSEDCDDDDRAAAGSVAIEGSHHDAVFE